MSGGGREALLLSLVGFGTGLEIVESSVHR